MTYPFPVKEEKNQRRVYEEIKKSGIYTVKPAEVFKTESSVNARPKSGNCSIM